MHQSAMHYGRRFFEVYVQRLPTTPIKLVEIGSLNVNGSLRDVCPTGVDYVGLDFSAGQGVDIVIEDPYKLPFTDDSVDVVVTSSCFEHSEFFWLVFLEAMRILKPGGLLYLNAPSNGFFHRWPVDCWRFYPDSGQALVRWAKQNGYDALLLESFIGERSAGRVSEGGMWNDFVAVVLKSASQRDRYPHRIVDALESFSNGFSSNRAGILNFDERGPDFSLIDAQQDRIDKLAREVETLRLEKTELGSQTVERNRRIEAAAQTITERDGTITALHGAMAERDRHLEAFARTITERDGTIAGLHGVVAERDRQFEASSRTIAERDATIAALRSAMSDRDWQVETSARQLGEHEATIANLHATLASRDHQIAELTAETVRRGEWAQGLHAELQEAHAQFNTVVHSNSWRMTLPLRETRRWISTPMHQFKRYARASLRLAKRAYQALPIDYQTKAAHRSFLAHRFPKVLLASGSHPASVPVLPMPLTRSPEARVEVPSAEQVLAGAPIDLTLATSANPKVSVIVPIYGKLDYTLRCLASIAGNPPVTPFEVIVVDDCSPDHSFESLSAVGGIRLIRNIENQGFIRSCNAGAAAARGDFLYFLNNDTEVVPGWLDELVRTFDEFPGTGLAGSKLIYPDGRLQEAGGIIWKDGSAWNFGRLQDPMLPIYNYAREVDYCSGASIMVPRNLFAELGGFDERYLPAYCEDSDLALKIRDRGHRVIYQPLSTVIHYEGITSGNDTSQGVKAYQIDNTRKLFERWRDRLQTHEEPGIDADAAKDRRATKRVLVIDHCTPTPNQDAGSVTVFNLMLLLREMGFQVTFIPEDNFLYMPDYTQALQRNGIEVLYAPYVHSVPQHLEEFGKRYHLALLFRPGVVERHLPAVRKYCPEAKVLFHTVDLHYLRMAREAELVADNAKQRAADEMKQRELAAIRAADASIVHSTAELEILKPQLPGVSLHVFPLIMNVRGTTTGFARRQGIVFVGGYQHAPNVDAVLYFVREVMPLLRQKGGPDLRFFVVGSKPPPEILSLATADIVIAGFVEKLTPLLDRMLVSVAPLRYGAGIKGKIGTSMAAGLPVVATSLAIEGMSLTDGKNVVVADGAEAFADAIVELGNDESKWMQLSRNGVEFADKAWGKEAAWRILEDILSGLGITPAERRYPLSLYQEGDQADSPNTSPAALAPLASVRSRGELEALMHSAALTEMRLIEDRLVQASPEAFRFEGFCVPCGRKSEFLVDMQSGGQRSESRWLPNWRERLVCPHCGMNNRQRLIATLVKQAMTSPDRRVVYFMEQVTPIFNWAKNAFPDHTIIGSEYLGYQYRSGETVNGIRHEDVENLSFADGGIDLIVSNDVFEHVPHPATALSECARVLRPGGMMLATIPFHQDRDASVTRARLHDGEVEHFLPPAFHGNPVSADGSLVFTDFGWDLVGLLRDSSFSDASIDVFCSAELGHLGGGQLVFRSIK